MTPCKCPRCDGNGRLSHPNLPAGQTTWVSNGTQDYECALCHGLGLAAPAPTEGL